MLLFVDDELIAKRKCCEKAEANGCLVNAKKIS